MEYIYILFCYVSWPSRFCLNPYYTGIHLHMINDMLGALSVSLNPYYTGIHLHRLWIFNAEEFIVLILIILEYIYIKQNDMTDWNFYVLILIILEYIYIKKWHVHSPDLLGLNPYYTGIHLHGFDRSGSPQCKCVLILIILEYIYIALLIILAIAIVS